MTRSSITIAPNTHIHLYVCLCHYYFSLTYYIFSNRANGGLAGSDVRILSRSSRKCTVTGIDSHELQGLDVVQCAALVETSHGIVNLIMNEYACYGNSHTIHSTGQIEWFKTQLMIGLSRLVENRGSAPLMAMPCHWFAEVASCTFLSLVNPLMQI